MKVARTASVLAILSFAGAGALALVGNRAPPADARGGAFERAFESRLRESAAGLQDRVATLAKIPRLSAAVATDVRTVRDLTQAELALAPLPGETIALAQIPASHGAPVLLLLAPEGAVPPPFASGPPRLRIVGGRLEISETVRVHPHDRADELDGAMAVSRAIGLDDLASPLSKQQIGARVVVAGESLILGRPPDRTDARRLATELGDEAGQQVQVWLLAAPARSHLNFWIGAVVLALAGIAFAGRARRGASVISPSSWPAVYGSGARSDAIGARSSTPSRRIGRYDIVRLIGSGGMAQVYLARSTGEAGFTKLLALKVLDPEMAAQPAVVAHFLDEAHLASQIDHPNVVQTIDLGRAGDDYFIAMEYVEGADLERLIGIAHDTKTAIPLPIALAIVRKVCDGLHAAHISHAPDGGPLGLVHRDVKSANVFIAKTGVVKIGDFGIAKANRANRLTRTEIGLVKGTPGYMAPEHRLGQPLDGRADLYGVGAIAYELLTGERINLDLAVLAQKGQVGWPHLQEPSRIRPEISPELDAIVFRALSYDREDRFEDCAALEASLEGVANRLSSRATEKTVAAWVEQLLAAHPVDAASTRAAGG